MRIVCPSCSAAFEVPELRLAPGQAVRCARCGTDWTPLAGPEPAVESEPTVLIRVAKPAEQLLPASGSEPTVVFQPALVVQDMASLVQDAPPAGKRRPIRDGLNLVAAAGPALVASWVVSIAAVAGLVWAAVAWRGDVMNAWPPSERLYMALGLPADRS